MGQRGAGRMLVYALFPCLAASAAAAALGEADSPLGVPLEAAAHRRLTQQGARAPASAGAPQPRGRWQRAWRRHVWQRPWPVHAPPACTASPNLPAGRGCLGAAPTAVAPTAAPTTTRADLQQAHAPGLVHVLPAGRAPRQTPPTDTDFQRGYPNTNPLANAPPPTMCLLPHPCSAPHHRPSPLQPPAPTRRVLAATTSAPPTRRTPTATPARASPAGASSRAGTPQQGRATVRHAARMAPHRHPVCFLA